jgi:hypothetical protein
MADTLLLDTATWDLVVDANGDIAVASSPYADAQDAASAIRTFQGELWYDVTFGVPYWAAVLGMLPPLALIKQKFIDAAESVSGVVSARVFISGFTGRVVTGQVQVTNTSGQTSAATF